MLANFWEAVNSEEIERERKRKTELAEQREVIWLQRNLAHQFLAWGCTWFTRYWVEVEIIVPSSYSPELMAIPRPSVKQNGQLPLPEEVRVTLEHARAKVEGNFGESFVGVPLEQW